MSTDITEKFRNLENVLGDTLLERTAEIHTSMLALIGRQHHFSLGTPGIAKSLLVDELCKRIAEVSKFSILMTKVTNAEEVLGGPNVKELIDNGTYERVTTGMLPEADVVFLDEIFKSNSAVLNALLRAINERKFTRGRGVVVDIPLHTLFAASNELAQSDELRALWDRLHFRHYTQGLKETSNFVAMLNLDIDPDPKPLITLDDMAEANTLSRQVKITDGLVEPILELKRGLLDEGIEVSDRRWREAINAIRSEAFINGNTTAQIEDMRPLMHFLWEDLDNIRVVRRAVLQIANPIEREAAEWMDDLEEAYNNYLSTKGKHLTEEQIGNNAVELHKKFNRNKEKLRELATKLKQMDRKSEFLPMYSALLSRVGETIRTDLAPIRK